jgi:hypothetical protein
MDMEFRFIDYSYTYYVGRKGPIPSKRGGKFIQLRNAYYEYVVLAPVEMCSYHANIVERFCWDEQIGGGYTTGKMDHYALKTAGWRIVGGGFWEMEEDRQWLSLRGASQAYGRFESEGLVGRIISHAGMDGFDVEII